MYILDLYILQRQTDKERKSADLVSLYFPMTFFIVYLSYQIWNDTRIVSDQRKYGSAVVASFLSKLNKKISVIVHTDRSAMSEIFTGALGLFDPRKQ